LPVILFESMDIKFIGISLKNLTNTAKGRRKLL